MKGKWYGGEEIGETAGDGRETQQQGAVLWPLSRTLHSCEHANQWAAFLTLNMTFIEMDHMKMQRLSGEKNHQPNKLCIA